MAFEYTLQIMIILGRSDSEIDNVSGCNKINKYNSTEFPHR